MFITKRANKKEGRINQLFPQIQHLSRTVQNVTSKTSIASILIKGSATCDTHILRIIGEMMGSIDAAIS